MSDEAKNEGRDPREVAAEVLGAALAKKAKARLDDALSRYRKAVVIAATAALREIRGGTDVKAARDFQEWKLRIICVPTAGLCGDDASRKLWIERYDELLAIAAEAESNEIIEKLDAIREYFES